MGGGGRGPLPGPCCGGNGCRGLFCQEIQSQRRVVDLSYSSGIFTCGGPCPGRGPRGGSPCLIGPYAGPLREGLTRSWYIVWSAGIRFSSVPFSRDRKNSHLSWTAHLHRSCAVALWEHWAVPAVGRICGGELPLKHPLQGSRSRFACASLARCRCRYGSC